MRFSDAAKIEPVSFARLPAPPDIGSFSSTAALTADSALAEH
jgi:hypothetical protein